MSGETNRCPLSDLGAGGDGGRDRRASQQRERRVCVGLVGGKQCRLLGGIEDAAPCEQAQETGANRREELGNVERSELRKLDEAGGSFGLCGDDAIKREVGARAPRVSRDRWPIQGQMARVFGFMQPSQQGDRELVPRWLGARAQPFAVHANETTRERTRVNLAFALGPSNPACLDVLADMEPNVPWVESMFDFRLNCYDAHRHPLRERAAEGLVLLRAGTPIL